MKRFLILILVIILAVTFTGCTSDEVKLYNAMSNMQNVTSMESDTTFALAFSAEGFPEEEQMKYQQMSAMLDTLKMSIHQKLEQNYDKDLVKAEADANIDFSGMAMDMKVWVDMDMSGDTPKFIEIIKMPQFIMSSMYPEDPAKEYIVYDIAKILGESQDMAGFSEFIKLFKEFKPKINEYMKDSLGNFNLGFELVKFKEKRIVDGNELTIYEIKMDDAALKNLIRYTVNYAIDDEKTQEFVKQYLNLVSKVANTSSGKEEINQEQIEEALDQINQELPELKNKFNSFMDVFKDIKIIGDQGIVLEYGVNSDGYIVHETGSIPLEINLQDLEVFSPQEKAVGPEEVREAVDKEDMVELQEAAEAVDEEAIKSQEEIKAVDLEEAVKVEDTAEKSGIFKINLTYKTKTYNINAPIEINMPEINEENSINIMDIVNSENEALNDASGPSDDLVEPSDDVVEPSTNVKEPSGENS